MIISKIQGGIGNQMFQYAYGRHLSNKYSKDLKLDLSFYSNQHGYTKREFLLNRFNINFDTQSKSRESTIHDTLSYRENILDKNKSYYIDGYWQNERYFIESSDLIKRDFKLNYNPRSGCTSIHVRRTDYVTSNGYHPTQSIKYYEEAVDYIGQSDKIYILSDDIGWCKDNFNFENMIFSEGNNEIEDLSIMASCDNNIIANSSFSWWGAWLNNNPNKKVVYPKKWFGSHTNISGESISPKEWIGI